MVPINQSDMCTTDTNLLITIITSCNQARYYSSIKKLCRISLFQETVDKTVAK